MTDSYAEITVDDSGREAIEEAYLIEEVDGAVCTVDIKQENATFEDEEYTHIVCLGKEENTGEDVFHCVICNTTFTSIEKHLSENHYVNNADDDSNIQMYVEELVEVAYEGENEEQLQADGKGECKVLSANIGYQNCETVFQTMCEAESHQCKSEPVDQQSTSDFEQTDSIHFDVKEEEHANSIFSCPDCSNKFETINALRQHQKTHVPKKTPARRTKRSGNSGNQNTHCSICNTTFSSAKNLKLHAKMHTATRTKTIQDAMPIGTEESKIRDQFYCEMCNKSFDHSLLTIHQNMHQNIEEYICGTCNRQFENQISYDMHMQLHTDQPTRVRKAITKPGAQFACNYCGREFLKPHEKVKHERVHTGEKPHECEVCGKCFRVPYSLTLHLRTHTDVRPFVCVQCNKRFKAYAVYAHHLNTHSEERPYKCPICPKSFRTSVQLCGHKNIHTKPYSCPECNRPFASMYAVKMHMKTHNKVNKFNNNFKCRVCGAIYARMFSLRFHMKEQHSRDLTPEELKNALNGKQTAETAADSFNEDEVSAQAIMQGEEIIIENFHTEEIITDWLTPK